MIRIRDLDDHRVNHRQVRGNWHAIVEEAGVIQSTVLVINVLFVQRPADTLGGTAVDLSIDIARMDRPADILTCCKAQDLYMPRFRIDFNIDHLRANHAHVTGRIL